MAIHKLNRGDTIRAAKAITAAGVVVGGEAFTCNNAHFGVRRRQRKSTKQFVTKLNTA